MHPRVAELRGDKVKNPNASKRKRIRARSSNKKQTQRVVAINKTMQKTKENSVIGEVTNYFKRKANSNEQTQSKRRCTDNSSNQQQIDDIPMAQIIRTYEEMYADMANNDNANADNSFEIPDGQRLGSAEEMYADMVDDDISDE